MALACCSLVAAACGTQLSDDDRAAFAAAQGGGGTVTQEAALQPGAAPVTVAPAADSAGATATTTTIVSGGSPGAAPVVASGPAPESTAPSPAATDQPSVAASGRTCADSNNEEKGVTAGAINLGGVYQLSGAVPGFGQRGLDGIQAYIAYVNATGGVCGRQVTYVAADDGFDSAKHAAESRRIEPEILSFLGGFSVVDAAQIPVLEETGAPDVSLAASAERRFHELHYGPFPGQSRDGYVTPTMAYLKSQGVTKGGLIYSNVAAARNQAGIERSNMLAAGIDVVVDREVGATQFSYASEASDLKDAGVEVMYMVTAFEASAQMSRELEKLGYDMPFQWHAIGYSDAFIETAGPDAAEGVVNFIDFIPFSDAGTNAELDLYLDWIRRVAPNTPPGNDSLFHWVTAKLFFDALRSIEGDITREALLEAFTEITSWNAGGILKGVDVANRTTPQCRVLVRVVNGQWTRQAPTAPGEFLC